MTQMLYEQDRLGLSDAQYDCLKRWVRRINKALVSMTDRPLREIQVPPEWYQVLTECRERDLRRFGWDMVWGEHPREFVLLGIPIRPGLRFRMVA